MKKMCTRGRRAHAWNRHALVLALLSLAAGARAEPATQLAAETPSRAVTLGELLVYAERQGPGARLARARKSYGQARVSAASTPFKENPKLSFGLGPRFEDGERTGVDLEGSLEQPLEIAGQQALRGKVARRAQALGAAEVASSALELRRAIVFAYSDAALARAQLELSGEALELTRVTFEATRRRFSAGEVGIVDVRLAEAEFALAREDQLLSARELSDTRWQLCELSGWPADRPPMPLWTVPDARTLPAFESLARRMQASHPELAARRAAIAEASARRELAVREGWPSPALGVSVTREGSRDGENVIVLGTLELPLPLWQRNEEQRAQAEHDRSRAEIERGGSLRGLDLRLRRAYAAAESARQRVELYRGSVLPSVGDSLGLLGRAFAAGEISLSMLTTARERLLDSRQRALRAGSDYYRALAELEALSGMPLLTATSGTEKRP
ncbi:MAG TPA: TolC family protein [Polyangiaceae bacterium]|nr:TolC family protein [Polyangiaceae bacterium]